jgi:hypothetical protein
LGINQNTLLYLIIGVWNLDERCPPYHIPLLFWNPNNLSYQFPSVITQLLIENPLNSTRPSRIILGSDFVC